MDDLNQHEKSIVSKLDEMTQSHITSTAFERMRGNNSKIALLVHIMGLRATMAKVRWNAMDHDDFESVDLIDAALKNSDEFAEWFADFDTPVDIQLRTWHQEPHDSAGFGLDGHKIGADCDDPTCPCRSKDAS